MTRQFTWLGAAN